MWPPYCYPPPHDEGLGGLDDKARAVAEAQRAKRFIGQRSEHGRAGEGVGARGHADGRAVCLAQPRQHARDARNVVV